jgi:hypothetical protein
VQYWVCSSNAPLTVGPKTFLKNWYSKVTHILKNAKVYKAWYSRAPHILINLVLSKATHIQKSLVLSGPKSLVL